MKIIGAFAFCLYPKHCSMQDALKITVTELLIGFSFPYLSLHFAFQAHIIDGRA